MTFLFSQGITQRRERFDVATANQLGSPSITSPTFSDVQWQSSSNNATRSASKGCDLQLTIRPKLVSSPAEPLITSWSPQSSSPSDSPKGNDRQPKAKLCQGSPEGKLGFSSPSAKQAVTRSHKKSRLSAAQIKQCSLIFDRSALLREHLDNQGISYSDIPLSAILPLVQGLKLPFDLLFRSLAICDQKIAGLPILAHSEKFVLSSRGLQIGPCKFLNLPISMVDCAPEQCSNGDRDNRVCGRTFISTEMGDPLKHNDSVEKVRRGMNRKNLWRCGDDLSFTLDFAQDMFEPLTSKKFDVIDTEEREEKKKRNCLLASRIDFSNIIRRIIELEDGNTSPLRPGGNYYRSILSALSMRPVRLGKSDMYFSRTSTGKIPMTSPTALVVPFDSPFSGPRWPRMCREFDFLCFIRLITEIQKNFIVLKPISQFSASSPSSLSSSCVAAVPSTPRGFLSSNYKLTWVSPALMSGHHNLNKTRVKANANANANANDSKKNNENKTKTKQGVNLLSLFAHTPSTELKDLVSRLATHESFMTKARWGPDAQRIWVCGVPVSDGSTNGTYSGSDKANGTDVEKSKTAPVDEGGGEGPEGQKCDAQQEQEQQHQHQQQQDQEQEQAQKKQQRGSKWWVLYLLNRRLARFILY